MKIIPFSTALELQRQSQQTLRDGRHAESAVWAICALSGVIGIVLSFGQITPTALRSQLPKGTPVVCDQPSGQPMCPAQES